MGMKGDEGMGYRIECDWSIESRCSDFRSLMGMLTSDFGEGLLNGKVRVIQSGNSCEYDSGKLMIAIENFQYIERMAEAFDKNRNVIKDSDNGYELEWRDEETGKLNVIMITMKLLTEHGKEYFRPLIEEALDINLGLEDD